MFSATLHRRAAIESFLISGTLASFSTATVASTSYALPLSDPLLEQFLPCRTHPQPHLRLILRLELLRQLATALKTDPQCSIAASSLLLGFHSSPLADLLCSLRNPRPALSFLLIAFPNLSPDAFVFSCDVAFLIFSTEKLKPLAQDILSGLLHRLSPHRATELLRWAALHHSYSTHYHALHLVLRAFLGAGMVSEALQALAEIRRVGNTPSLSVHAILLRLLFRTGDSRNAWKLFRDMILRGPRPSVRTFNAMILGSCLKGRVAAGEGLFWLFPKYKLEPDACSFNIVMKAHCMFGRAGNAFKLAFDTGRAERYFELMASRDCKPDIFTYNIRIHSLCSSYKTPEAIKIVDMLISDGFTPNTVTHNTVMNGICADSLGRAMILTGKLIKMAVVPNVVTVNLLLSHFCKQGLAERALIWAEKFKKVSFDFDDVTLHILDKASRYLQKESEAKVASGKDLFLEFLMHIAYELICNNNPSSKHKPLTITSLVDNGLTGASRMMDIRLKICEEDMREYCNFTFILIQVCEAAQAEIAQAETLIGPAGC
ncbi:hypothetical protein M5K25_016950 [Dendrobium thyrsiflorum]|uniref:Pentatricopeptide repeat-containing protein n=1 Tax=Dendrobium thyrsiflorum TaxID=117978 RepID=A0ABD0ULH6_DENTH